MVATAVLVVSFGRIVDMSGLAACLIAALASWLRGGHYVHDLHGEGETVVGSLGGEVATPTSEEPAAIPG